MINQSFLTGFAAGAITVVLLFGLLGLGFAVIRPWIRMKMMGGRGTLVQVLAMRLRGTPPNLIIDAYTSLLHSGVEVHLREVESQYVANRAKTTSALELMEHVREHKRRREQAD